MASALRLPSREEELCLHSRLAEGDLTASADLCRAYLNHLIEWLTNHNSRRISKDFIVAAAGDALVALIKNPHTYDPSRQSLTVYLHMSAQGDLKNELSKESRRRAAEKNWESVEDVPETRKCSMSDCDPAVLAVINEEIEIANRQVLPLVQEGLNEAELRALELMQCGERKTVVFAEACGLAHLPKSEQEAEVKRIKDKLKKRIQRGRA